MRRDDAKRNGLPCLLSPAGTPEALDAAIAAGADAVYFGADAFNARMFAGNFPDTAEAIAKCRFFGVESNITLNTMMTDGELPQALALAERLLRQGADALIVADLGLAAALHRLFPDAVLHASTQCGGHSLQDARALAAVGFSRMVAARELSADDLLTLCRRSPIETELFIHGALCVSRSGSCLFSAMVGGRSGNRGACAQPCRLPCRVEDGHGDYALSLKDLCLAAHVPQLCDSGAAALKIEGRMKSPAYVYGVTRMYRTLLDERRAATAQELDALAALFSRGGFTDAYFRGHPDRGMAGVRGEHDKVRTAAAEAQLRGITMLPQLPVTMHATVHADAPMMLSVTAREVTVTVTGQLPQPARTAPLREQTVAKQISKLGGTPFVAASVTADVDDGLALPPAALNAQRRAAVTELQARLQAEPPCAVDKVQTPRPPLQPVAVDAPCCQAVFQNASQIPRGAAEQLARLFLPLSVFCADTASALAAGVNGVLLPWVIPPAGLAQTEQQLRVAAQCGIAHALAGSVGQAALAAACGMTVHGDLSLNIWNSEALAAHASLGFADALLSPELGEAAFGAVTPVLAKGVVVYGRLPLMHLARCIRRNAADCRVCEEKPFSALLDRRGVRFPLSRGEGHTNFLWNSVPTYLLDRKAALRRAGAGIFHLIFTDETRTDCAAVLQALQNGDAPQTAVRRMGTRSDTKGDRGHESKTHPSDDGALRASSADRLPGKGRKPSRGL